MLAVGAMTVRNVCIDCEMSLACIGGALPYIGLYKYEKLYTLYTIHMQVSSGGMSVNVPIGCPRVEITPKKNALHGDTLHWGPRT